MKGTVCRRGNRITGNSCRTSHPQGDVVRGRAGARSCGEGPPARGQGALGGRKMLARDESAMGTWAGSLSSRRSSRSLRRWWVLGVPPCLHTGTPAPQGASPACPSWAGVSRPRGVQAHECPMRLCLSCERSSVRNTGLRLFFLNMFIFAGSASEDLSL